MAFSFDKKKLSRLREVILEGQGDMPQYRFAKVCGMRPETLSRLMKSSSPARPSKTTLQGIAGACGADYAELLELCGYQNEAKSKRQEQTMESRAARNAELMKEGFGKLFGGPYDSIRSFFETYIMLYDEDGVKISWTKDSDYDGTDHKGSYCSLCRCRFESAVEECAIWFILYYFKTDNGKYFVTDMSMDLASIRECEMEDLLESQGYIITEDDKPLVCRIRPLVYDSRKLLDAIFGNTEEIIPYTEVGFGFNAESGQETVISFINRHSEAFKKICDKRLFERYEASDHDPAGVLEEYIDPLSGYDGIWAAAASIMREETGFPYGFYGLPGKKGAVLIKYPISDYDENELMQLTAGYAKELGIKSIGERYALVEYAVDKNNDHDVEEVLQ